MRKEGRVPKIIHQETMCCGYKKCPTVTVFEDGSMEIRDDDTNTGPISLKPEQVNRIVELATQKKEL